MASKVAKKSSGVERPACTPGVLLAVRASALAAMGVATYLAWVSLGGHPVIGCGPSSNCRELLHSRWAYWLGVPVSMFAVVAYTAVFGGTFLLRRGVSPEQQRKAWFFLIPWCLAIIGAGGWFVVVQLFALRRVCPLCMATHSFAVLAAATLLYLAPMRRSRVDRSKRQTEAFPASTARKLLALGAGAVATLVVGQLLYQPAQYVAESAGTGPAVQISSVEGSKVRIFGGEFEFDLQDVPLIGRSDAPHVFVALFDYTCYACKVTHGYLLEAQGAFSNQFAVVSLPAPLDGSCNPTITNIYPAHTNACQYARLALAVWKAKPAAFEQFDRWLFDGQLPSLDQALLYGAQLVGQEALDAALKEGGSKPQLERGLAIYARNYAKFGRESMPQVIIGTNVYFGTFNKKEKFFQLLANELALPGRN